MTSRGRDPRLPASPGGGDAAAAARGTAASPPSGLPRLPPRERAARRPPPPPDFSSPTERLLLSEEADEEAAGGEEEEEGSSTGQEEPAGDEAASPRTDNETGGGEGGGEGEEVPEEDDGSEEEEEEDDSSEEEELEEEEGAADEEDGLSDDSDLMDDASDEDEEEEEEDDETEAVDAEQRGTSAAAAAAAAAGQQQAPWERFASLAWSKGREPDHTCYIQKHVKLGTMFQVQVCKPSARTGTSVPCTVADLWPTTEDAARGRDVALCWMRENGEGGASWGQEEELGAKKAANRLHYSGAGYSEDAALRSALRGLDFAQLRTWMRTTFLPGGAMLRKPPVEEDGGAAAGAGSVARPVTANVVENRVLRFKVEHLEALGWRRKEGDEAPPPTLVTLPARLGRPRKDQPAADPRQLLLTMGRIGRDGAAVNTKLLQELVDRTGVNDGDTLVFERLPGSGGADGSGQLRCKVGVQRARQEQQRQPGVEQAPPVTPATHQGGRGAGSSGGAGQQHRRKGTPRKVDSSGAAGAAGTAGPSRAARPAGSAGKACSNCHVTDTPKGAWARHPLHPDDAGLALCNACSIWWRRKGSMRPADTGKRPRAAPQPEPADEEERAREQGEGEAEPRGKRHRREHAAAPAAAAAAAAQQQQADQAQPAASLAPLPPDASWEQRHERLGLLLEVCGVRDVDALRFRFELTKLPLGDRGTHFVEVETLHQRGKPALVKDWVALVLQA